jgi:exodeoxyribonuclease V gamma subunit
MLRVVHSDSVARLASELCNALPQRLGPFAEQQRIVIVGNRVVGHWLRQRIANARGIAVGVTFVGFDQFIATTFTSGLSNDGSAVPCWAISRREMSLAIASCLASPALHQDPALRALADYVTASNAVASQARRVQLAERLAALFWSYSQTRPHWLRTGRWGDDGDLNQRPMAQWQARLYQVVIGSFGRELHAPTPMVPALCRDQSLKMGAPISVFGFSYFNASQLATLQQLAQFTDVTVYQQNPCAEFWDDAGGRKGARDPAHVDPLPLTLWGSPVRHTIAALIEATGGDFTDAFDDNTQSQASAHPLHRLLADTRARIAVGRTEVPVTTSATRSGDVAILACPSRRRELEVIGASVLSLLAKDTTLHATDIAVLVAGANGDADADRYFLGVPFAFERAGGVPFHLVDAPIGKNGGAADALLALLALPGSQFTRSDMLRVMTHPMVIAGFPHAVASDWVAWTERLGVVHGRNAADHQHTYLADSPVFDWEHGVRRLALGNFATGLRSGRGPIVVGNVAFAPYELNADESADAATFALLARSLISDATWLAVQRRTLTGWSEVLLTMATAYLVAATPAAQRELDALVATVRGFAELHSDDRELDFVEMKTWVERWLNAGRGDRGELLISGVMVGPLQSMRSLPFRHIFIAGLGESQFPVGQRISPLDLRISAQRGDVSDKDRDRYAFFEALQSALDSVTLSYVSQDETTGEKLGPSTVLLELCDALVPYLGVATSAEALRVVTQRVSMFSFRAPSDSIVAPLANDGRLRWADRVRSTVRESFRRAGQAIPDDSAMAAAISQARPDLRGLIASGDRISQLLTLADAQTERVLNVSTFRKFFESPVQAWAMATMELRDSRDDDDSEIAARINEPFANSDIDRAMLLRDVMDQSLRQPGSDVASLYIVAAKKRALQGQSPVGVFADATATRDIAVLERWRAALGVYDVDQKPVRYAFGRSHAATAHLLPSPTVDIVQDGKTKRVRLVGTTETILAHVGSVIFRGGSTRHSDHVRGMIDHLLLSVVAEQFGSVQHRGHRHVVIDSDGVVSNVTHAAWPAGEASKFLGSMVSELLTQDHAYVLPFDQMRQARAGKPASGARGIGDSPLGFGPVVSEAGLLTGDAVVAMAPAVAARRLSPMADLMSGDHKMAAADA